MGFATERFAGMLIEGGLRASAVLLAALVLRWLLRRARLPRLLDLLWAVVLLRLLIPALPAAPWSAFNVIAGAERSFQAGPRTGPPLAPSVVVLPSSEAPAAPLPLRARPARVAVTAQRAAPVLLAVWVLGALAAAAMALRAARASQGLVARSTPIDEPPVHALLLDMQRRLRLRRLPALRASAEVRSPALAGWWQPVVLLPAGLLAELSLEARTHVLLHEIGHLCRRDLWFHRLFKLALVFHWWNPLVWWADRLARADRELACDDWVLRRLGGGEVCAYGETLLCLSLRLSPAGRLFGAEMAEDGSRLRDRVRRIARWQSAPGWRTAVAGGLLIAFGAAALADEHPGPLRPLPFVAHLDAPAGDQLQVEGLWADDGHYADARRFRVRGRYQVAGCDQAVVVAETLGAPSPEPSAAQVQLVSCGTGRFELDFAAPDGARGGVVVALMNARGACGLVAVALTPSQRSYGLPSRSVRDVCWRSGKGVKTGYEHLAWVGEPASTLIEVGLTPGARRSDSLATERSALLFENQSSGVVFLHWMDFRGRPRLYGFLSPGESYRAWTTRNHVWTVASDRGRPLGSVRALAQPGRVVIR